MNRRRIQALEGEFEGEYIYNLNTNQTPTNSISTSLENVFLNAFDCFHPRSSVDVYILYAKGTCCVLEIGRRPTL